jgi:uncharacterized protein YjbI with pentapeptide repeats
MSSNDEEYSEDLKKDLGWKVCTADECLGVCLSESILCLAHMPIGDRRQLLFDEATAGRPLDLRGIVLDEALLDACLRAYREVCGPKKLPGLLLEGAVVKSGLRLSGYDIPQGINARAAFFDEEIDLTDTQVGGMDWKLSHLRRGAVFTRAKITGAADFRRVRTFSLDLSEAHFMGLDLGELLCVTLFDMSSSEVADTLVAVDAQFHGVTVLRKAHLTDCSFDRAKFGVDIKLPDEEQGIHLPDIDSGVYLLDVTFGGKATFSDALFGGPVSVTGSHFESTVSFSGAKFAAATIFREVQFGQHAYFDDTEFSEDLEVLQCRFEGPALFHNVHFHKNAQLSLNRFVGVANAFYGIQFDGDVSFLRSEFVGEIGFFDVAFRRSCSFERVTFASGIHIDGIVFSGDVRWDRARIDVLQQLTIVAKGAVSLDYVRFLQGVHLIICAQRLSLRNAHFEKTSSIGVCGCEILLDSANFTQPTTLYYRLDTEPPHAPGEKALQNVSVSGVHDPPESEPTQEEQLTPVRHDESLDLSTEPQFQDHARPVPRLLSVRHANVGQLSVINIDLSTCLFEGAQSLDTMTIEGRGLFTTVSGLRYRLFSTVIPVQWWTRRQVLAEELIWRLSHRPSILLPPGSIISSVGGVDASRIAAIYRALRKSRELMKDEPGAADFYYGEMEMRRHSERGNWSERLILFLYWATAGYGLRGSRSLICLVALTLLATMMLITNGFIGTSPAVMTVTLASAAMIGRIGLAGIPPMTSLGQAVRLTLEFIGPLLLGLMLLSIRNRLKR